MELFEAIAKRRSYRGKYVDQPVPAEDLRKIVEAGVQAPSGCNAQSTSFIIVDSPEVMAGLRKIIPIPAPAVIACVVDHSPVYKGMSFEAEDCAAAVENMLLAVIAMGYASVWLDGALRGGAGEKIGRLLGVPAGKTLRVLLPVGVPTGEPSSPDKRPFEERVFFNSYGSSASE